MKRPSSPKTHSSLIGILAVSTLAFFAFSGCDKTVAVTGVRLDKTSISLTEGESANLVATVEPATSTNGSVTWTSTDAAVASVNNGLVKALKEGITTVTVTTADGGKIATCSVTVKSAKIPVDRVTLDKASLALTEGESGQLMATVTPANATDPSVSWNSSDAGIASVDKSGKVTAVKAGAAIITVTTTDGGKKDVCLVTVKAAVVNVTGVTLDKTSVSLLVGQTQQLKATVAPDEATDKSVSWSSSNPNVAAVDENGYVTGKASGSATVTVVTTNGSKMATCDFSVKQPVTGVSLDKTSLSVVEGESATLTATVAPADATDKEVAWSTSDASIATVDDGKVTAVKEGLAKITVTTKDGNKTAECAVTVSRKVIDVTGVELNKTQLNLETGTSETLVASVAPANATDKSVVWTTSAPEIATVSDNGKVTAVKAGDAVITVKTTDGGKRASCDITVTDKEVKPTDITVTPSALALIVGQTGQLTASIAPDDATDKSVKWTSSNSNIATLDELGKVTAISGGEATIIATTNSGDLSASCDVKVTQPVSGIKLDKSEVMLIEGETATLTATIEPKDASDKTVAWSTGDANTAAVEDESTLGTISAKVTAVKAGTVMIAVTTKEGDKTAECAVTVKPAKIPVTSVTLDKAAETLATGTTLQLTATVKPDDATDKSVAWTTSAPEIATVSGNGKVTAVKAGDAVITIKTTDGGKMASCDVTVTDKEVKPTDITVTPSVLALIVGQTGQLTASIAPDDATDKSVSWSSSNPSAADVDANGLVSAKSTGEATITVTTTDGGKMASCDVTVKELGINIPDANFKAYLVAYFDKDGDEKISLAEATAVTKIDCREKSIASLEGIQYFTSLTVLYCSVNQLTSLDVSKNTALIGLDCYGNRLTSLDVSKNTALAQLNCLGNQLTSLDVSKNTALTELHCDSNQLTSLDVSKNNALTELSCSYSQLTSLDVSKNTALTHLECYYNQLTSLDVSKNVALTQLYCINNRLTSLDASTMADYSSFTLECGWQKTVGGRDATLNLTLVTAQKTRWEALISGEFKVNTNVNVTYKDAGDNINIPDANFKAYLVTNFDKDGDEKISIAEAADVTKIDCSSKSIAFLEGIQYFTSLTELTCDSNSLTSLDVSMNAALTELHCSNNQLTSLDASKNVALTQLYCGDNQLTSLDVSKNTRLTQLWCWSNQLTSLDVSKNTALTKLDCDGNRLTSLDVGNNTALITLGCAKNQFTSLDVSKNTALTKLDCDGNQLTSLDVSNNTKLTQLYCFQNQFTSLDASKNTELKSLVIAGNKLTSLDVSNNTKLTQLYCFQNQLTSLDASTMANQSAFELYCGQQKSAGGSDATLNLTLVTAQKTRWEALISGESKGLNTNVNVTYTGSETTMGLR